MPSDVTTPLEVREVLNAAGTMTPYGAAVVDEEIIEAVSVMMRRSVDMRELQNEASQAISRAFGSEAGCVTNCAAAGVSVAVAACMTSTAPALIEQLPDTSGMRDQVIMQKGHDHNYGAPITQAIRLPGASPVEVGRSTGCGKHHVQAAIGPSTAGGFFVTQLVPAEGLLDLRTFASLCHEHDVPVIVDAAAPPSLDLRIWIEAGADLVICSAHKLLGGATAGIIAGRRDLIRACYHQEIGIGRPMKAGKEGVAGAIAVLGRWTPEFQRAREERWRARVVKLEDRLRDLPGMACKLDYFHGLSIPMLRLTVDPEEAGFTAYDLAEALRSGDPFAVFHDSWVANGWLALDPSNASDENIDRLGDLITAVWRGVPRAPAREYVPTVEDFVADWHIGWPR